MLGHLVLGRYRSEGEMQSDIRKASWMKQLIRSLFGKRS